MFHQTGLVVSILLVQLHHDRDCCIFFLKRRFTLIEKCSRYYKYFLGKLHQNFIGQDTDKNVFILSVLQEKSYGKLQYRAVLWTKNGPKRLQFRSEGKSVTIKQVSHHLK